jgi:hypothetical protein
VPRVSKRTTVQVKTARSFQSHRIKSFNVAGRPPATPVQQTFPVIPPKSYFKAGVTRLLKRDVSKGLSMPEADALPFIGGVLATGTSTYGGQRIMHLQPQVPPSIAGSGNSKRKLIPPPSPTNNGGVRSPYNQKVVVARVKKSRRVG